MSIEAQLTEDLTDDQRKAAEAFADWLTSPADGTPFVLSGFAGSGKTFLSMRLLRMVEVQGLCWTVVAPTHKAVGVLRQALDLEGLQPTWYPSTIHRLLRLKLKRVLRKGLKAPLHTLKASGDASSSRCLSAQLFDNRRERLGVGLEVVVGQDLERIELERTQRLALQLLGTVQPRLADDGAAFDARAGDDLCCSWGGYAYS